MVYKVAKTYSLKCIVKIRSNVWSPKHKVGKSRSNVLRPFINIKHWLHGTLTPVNSLEKTEVFKKTNLCHSNFLPLCSSASLLSIGCCFLSLDRWISFNKYFDVEDKYIITGHSNETRPFLGYLTTYLRMGILHDSLIIAC